MYLFSKAPITPSNAKPLWTPKKSLNGAIRLLEDDLTGEGDSDDEQLYLYLENVLKECISVHIYIVIFPVHLRNQHFSQVKGASTQLFKGINSKEKG